MVPAGHEDLAHDQDLSLDLLIDLEREQPMKPTRAETRRIQRPFSRICAGTRVVILAGQDIRFGGGVRNCQ